MRLFWAPLVLLSALLIGWRFLPATQVVRQQPPEKPGLVLVEKGKARAEIVVAEQRPRMVSLAALELQHFLHKMSGVRLPIVTVPTAENRVRIFLGVSPETERLGIKPEGLRYGAYRIVSGNNWLVLLGRDQDFDPSKLPWPLKRGDVPRAEKLWAESFRDKTDTGWGFPFVSGFKGWWNPSDFNTQLSRIYGDDFAMLWKKEGTSGGFWNQDEGGTLNAVYGLLQGLGVRWFMPGELGQIVPEMQTVTVGPFDAAVKPSYPLREWNWYNFSGFSYDDVIRARRIGMNSGHELLGPNRGPHGLVNVHEHPLMRKQHPDYFALIGGQRDTAHRDRGTPCFTATGLEEETVNYVRFLFDRYDLPSVDLWPVDGLKLCQCETCKGKSASDLVWGFIDRVARKVHKTHPDRRITCGAYTTYSEAPNSIEKFSPNLAVWISNASRPRMLDPEHWSAYQERLKKWQAKIAPGNILRLENNRYHIWGEENEPIAYPVIHPRSVARDLKALKGISLGDTGEQSQVAGTWRAPGLEHITLYIQARFLWDADQDLEQVLDDYFDRFYGPAAKHMKEAITFAEENLAVKDVSRGRGRGNPANVPLSVSLKLRALLEAANKAAGDTVYRKRIQLILSELQPTEQLKAQYQKKEKARAEARAKAPSAMALEGAPLAQARVYTLKDNRTGGEAAVKTTFRTVWEKNAILFEIVCQEPNMKKLQSNRDVFSGDNVVVSLETPNHSYYHLEINPEGTLVEGKPGGNWKSLAEVQAKRGEDYWQINLRIPVVGAVEAESDPRHRVAGSKPTPQSPWYFNIGRQRVLDLKTPELQAFSPTREGWHNPDRFGKLQVEK